ncbi:hypothetical protein M431DRAFT_499812 [Trichoderma harzianum CBS 226.95]|uniref:Uncharacterized protein n=1 Tax=Trichoderma harzianum CBS 226.95 TaxID=983964 RepID=A0A2T3ZY99_TRIHA|nr:hypothetical protein M431DRAFT_499812 [Trichoderma harzianum CBS 226.95]PTB49790.1 hypothetical protein M431DRAFT_499812 [Trichoderma harzianum CBS 226.95]
MIWKKKSTGGIPLSKAVLTILPAPNSFQDFFWAYYYLGHLAILSALRLHIG